MPHWSYRVDESADGRSGLVVRWGRQIVLSGMTAVIAPSGAALEMPPPGRPTVAGVPFGRDLFIDVIPASADPQVALLRARYCGKALDGQAGVAIRIGDWPHFEQALAIARTSSYWTQPVWLGNPSQMHAHTQFLLVRRKVNASQKYLAILPLTDGGMRGELRSTDGQGSLVSASGDSQHVPCGFLMAGFAVGDDPYELTERVFAAALKATGFGRLRRDKPLPAFVDEFGWCSWNCFGHHVDQDGVLKALKSFAQAGLPVSYCILDDGWQKVTSYGADPKARRFYGLSSFDAEEGKRFPEGLAGLIRRARQIPGLRRFGVWHTLQGYWGGLDPNGLLARHYETFRDLQDRPMVKPADAHRFFSDYHASLRGAGVDLVKVDNQSNLEHDVARQYPIGQASMQLREALDGSIAVHFAGQGIHCMAMSSDLMLQIPFTNVARNSDDYYPNQPNNPGLHVRDNAFNNLWTSQAALPDWDMFESHHPYAEMHVIARAVSGSPVYCTDTPGKQNYDLLRKLMLSNGQLLRCPRPAQVTEDCLMTDPLNAPTLLKVFNTLDTGHGLLAVFNCRRTPELDTEGARPTVFSVKQRQALTASAWFGPADVHGLEESSQWAVYSHHTGRLQLMKRNDRAEITLEKFAADLLVLAPVGHGLAILGLLDKFNSPRALEAWGFEGRTLIAQLADGGMIGLYSATRPRVKLNGKAIPAGRIRFDHSSGLVLVKSPRGKGVVVEVRSQA